MNFSWRFWQRSSTALAVPGASQALQLAAPATVVDASTAIVVDAKASRGGPPEDDFQISGARKISRYYPTDNLDPESLKYILRQADYGCTFLLMELLDDVSADAHVQSQLSRMTLSVAGSPWVMDAGDESDAAQGIAEEATKFIKRIPRFLSLKINLLDGEFRGFACIKPTWTAEASRWWVTDWEAIETRFFRFTQNDTPLIETLRVPTGEPVPPGMLFHVVRDKAGRIVRGGCFRAVLKPWLYKSYAMVDALSFLERFGHPHVQVQLGSNIKEGSPELERAKAAARSFITDQIGLCPPGVTMAIVDAVNKAANVEGVYLSVVKFCDAAISKATTGQTETTEGTDTGGGFSRAKVHLKVDQSLRELRGGRLDETLNEQLLTPWTRFHYGLTAPVPRIRHLVEAPEDEAARANAEKTRAETIKLAAHDIGVKVATRQVRAELRLKEPDAGEETIGGAPVGKRDNHFANATGVCPSCNGHIDLSAAEKKKHAVSWAT